MLEKEERVRGRIGGIDSSVPYVFAILDLTGRIVIEALGGEVPDDDVVP